MVGADRERAAARRVVARKPHVQELELLDGDKPTGTVGSGEFLFPGEVLGAGAAPRTARGGSGGALILFGDRMIAQELLVTCPPLLEVFAGM